MSKGSRRVFLTFPQNLIREPVIYHLGHKFDVVTNVRQANVEQDIGWMILELEGDEDEVGKALDYLRDQKIEVQPAEADLVE